MSEYTPEKVAELVAELEGFAAGSESARATLMRDAAAALTAVSAERDAVIRDLDAGFAESDHLSAKYYQRMRDAEREMHARELHHFEEEQISADLRADRDRLHKAITEALAFESVLPAIATEPRRILRAALDKGQDDDE